MMAALPPNGFGQKTLLDHWRNLNRRGKMAIASISIAYFGARTVEKLPGVISAVFTRRK